MSSLYRLLEEERDPTSPVAWRWDADAGRDVLLTWNDFRGHVAAARARVAAGPPGSWTVVAPDAYAMAVALFSLWTEGRSAVSPPNLQPETLVDLESRSAGLLDDAGYGTGSDPGAAPGALEPDAEVLELFTSGSTGDGKAVTKRLRHLDDEVRVLEEVWGAELGGACVFSTASHYHLYGLLFGVLWPLAAGRPFHADHLLRGAELAPRMRARGRVALAAVPAHLRRLAQQRDTASLRAHVETVFSSGGLLPTTTAHHLASLLGHAPVEVFGSTETGGVAWRRQEPDVEEAPWTPLPGVSLDRDPALGTARVRSPFVSVGDGGTGFAMGDRIAFLGEVGGRFQLQGRMDRVAKVGEKRLDLAAMESDLRGHPLLDDVALVALDRVAAVCVPSTRGRALLESEGRRAFGRALAEDLATRWDPVLVPRTWRNVERLPENPQGKITVDALRALFRDGGAGDAQEDRPQLDEPELRTATSLERGGRVPADLSILAGHFPGHPVVPGVLQTDWALELAADLLGGAPRVQEIRILKFRAPLGPGDRFRIRVWLDGDGDLHFRLWGSDHEHASGRVALAGGR